MATPMKKSSPVWLAKQDENDPTLNKNYRRSVRYYRKLYAAWPDWLADDPRYAEIYQRCKALRGLGFDVQVDHVVPICSDLVCGLHVPWNLEIINTKVNLQKSNTWWPDHPFTQRDMFDSAQPPHQSELGL